MKLDHGRNSPYLVLWVRGSMTTNSADCYWSSERGRKSIPRFVSPQSMVWMGHWSKGSKGGDPATFRLRHELFLGLESWESTQLYLEAVHLVTFHKKNNKNLTYFAPLNHNQESAQFYLYTQKSLYSPDIVFFFVKMYHVRNTFRTICASSVQRITRLLLKKKFYW